MQLERIDWFFVFAFFAVSLLVGFIVARQAGKNVSEFFLSGRNMPWWLLGMSMVATTFSTDTPNLVSNIVRKDGVAGNWVWWAFLLTGMLTVFVYAKLWRRSKVTTDLEFYELRYSGKAAAFLRGFRALYLGAFFNMCIMGTVSLAAIKIGRVMLGLNPLQTILIASTVTVIFSAMGGLRAVLITDFLLFIIAMTGAVAAAVIALNHQDVGGLSGLIAHPNVQGKLSIIPPLINPDGSSNKEIFVGIFLIPLAVQWWSAWYPGAEPGGGSYVAQRMLAAKNETHAVKATLFFNVAHYALRPWPWILVALCSLIIFPFDTPQAQKSATETLASAQMQPALEQWNENPDTMAPDLRLKIESLKIQEKGLTAIKEAFPKTEYSKIGHDLAYPAMLTFLPHGLLGLVVASLIAAYMSTISTHLNLGSSYIVNDFWRRFIKPNATEQHLVWVGRLFTVLLMVLAGAFAILLEDALQAFKIMLLIGAGTGLLFILRWFWWRINPFSEITAMVVSFVVAMYMHFGSLAENLASWEKFVIGVGITTFCWVVVTFLTPSDKKETLRNFYKLIQPGGPGWKKVIRDAEQEGISLEAKKESWDVPHGILCMVLGCLTVYSALFAIGYWIYGKTPLASILSAVVVISAILLIKAWGKLRMNA